jgi:hypothetical protein
MASVGCPLLKLRHCERTEDEIGVGINARFPRCGCKEVVRSAGPSCVTALSFKTPRSMHQLLFRLLASWTNRLIRRRSVVRRRGAGRNGLMLAMSTPSIGLPCSAIRGYRCDQVSLIKSGRSCIQSSLLTPPG